MPSPLFSIIVPVYKIRAEYLDACIQSIMNQTLKNFELILVDDGSPDNCGELCDGYAEKDSRIRVIHQTNGGVSAARNNGLSAAQGEWILFVDADDWIETDALEILHGHIMRNNCDILMFRGIRENADRSISMEYGLKSNHLYDLTQFEDKELFYKRVIDIPHEKNGISTPIYYSWDKAYSRSFLLNHKIEYPLGIAKSEDKIFIAQCFEKASSVYHVDDQLYHYRLNNESVCHRYSSNMKAQRTKLALCLEPIACRMDQELGEMCQDSAYNKITVGYQRFLLGIVSDVLILQYYHADNPNRQYRRKDAIAFLKTEPFHSMLENTPYSYLGKEGKLKKFLLKHRFVSLCCFLIWLVSY